MSEVPVYRKIPADERCPKYSGSTGPRRAFPGLGRHESNYPREVLLRLLRRRTDAEVSCSPSCLGGTFGGMSRRRAKRQPIGDVDARTLVYIFSSIACRGGCISEESKMTASNVRAALQNFTTLHQQPHGQC